MLKFKNIVGRITMAILLLAATFGYSNADEGKNIGLQLYSLREQLPKDVRGTLEKVAKAGYNQVELYGFSIKDQFWGLSPKELKAILDENKLTPISGHFNVFPYLKSGDEQELNAAIEAAKILGLKYITIPWLMPDMRKNEEDYHLLAKRLNYAGKLCKAAGISLAYHNHDFEFTKYGGKTALDILLRETNKSLVSFELDIYWAIRSGVNLQTLFNANKGRFVMWHVKDMDKANPKLNAEVGTGSIDYKDIFKLKKMSGMKYFFVEHETNYKPNPIESVKKSCEYIRNVIL